MDARNGLGKIYMAAPIQPKDLVSRVKEIEVVKWDTRKGGLIANKELKIGNIILQAKPLSNPSQTAINDALIDVIRKEGNTLLHFEDAFVQVIARIASLKKWETAIELPDISFEQLLKKPASWLEPFIIGVKKNVQI